MTLTNHKDLWTNIQQFALDDPYATISFSGKLASQQKWSAVYTQRVIEEYKRFIFLCCISSTGASPSKAIDEAWHLHLTYTHSYWIGFCRDTLGKDIHHHPSAGGEQEDHKHEQWYKETLDLYQQVFGALPPADIWPSPVANITTPVTIPAGDNKKQVCLIVALLILPFIVSGGLFNKWIPFWLTGPQFLAFYAMQALASVIAFYSLRKSTTRGIEQAIVNGFPADMNIYQVTHFMYGKHRAFQTALVDLFRRNLLEVNDNNNIIVYPGRYQAPPTEINPLIPGLLAQQDGAVVYYKLISMDWYQRESFSHPGVERLDALVYPKQSLVSKCWMLLPAFAMGILRILQGWVNDRPVAFLFLEIIAIVVTVVIMELGLSKGNRLFDQAEAYLLEGTANGNLHGDAIVGDFAKAGSKALVNLSIGAVLAGIFVAYPIVLPGTVLLTQNTNTDGGCSSTDSCSSGGGGGGSSCGGGGGCGGCSGSS